MLQLMGISDARESNPVRPANPVMAPLAAKAIGLTIMRWSFVTTMLRQSRPVEVRAGKPE